MRLRLIFNLKNKGAILPFHHQKLVSDLIHDLIGEYGSILYSFSGVKGQTKVGREGLHYFSRKITIVFSCLEPSLAVKLSEAVFSRDHFVLGNLLIEPDSIEEEVFKGNFSEKAPFLCISPVVLLNTPDNQVNKEFIHPSMDRFSDLMYESTMERMEKSGYYSAEDIKSFYRFQVLPDYAYLEKISKSSKKFARIYSIISKGEVKEIRGYTFPFTVYADAKVLDFLYNSGVGEMNEYGFGMVDLVEKHKIERVVVRESVQDNVFKE